MRNFRRTCRSGVGPLVQEVSGRHRAGAQDVPALEVRDLAAAGVRSADLRAYPGRVLGLYGLVGAGRTEALRTIAGIDPARSGRLWLRGRPFAPRTPRQAHRRGVVYLTEERKRDGIVPGLDPAINVALPVLRRYTRWGWLNRRAMRADARGLLDRLDVRGDRQGPVVSLSGGNQQKVLLARVLAQDPQVLLLDEPTKGVDIGVKVQIHRMIRQLAHERGMAVVVASSEEDEILEVADDVAVFIRGRCDGSTRPADGLTVAELRRAAWSESGDAAP